MSNLMGFHPLLRDSLKLFDITERAFESAYLGKSEWVWVTGYKGTDKDMKCKDDFQYELGERYDMPDDAEIKTCSSGFHFCLNLEDVFKYVPIGNGNRYFKVEAFVRKADVDFYGKQDPTSYFLVEKVDKLAAKSIVLTRELTADEILESVPDVKEWSEEVKQIALRENIKKAIKLHRAGVLVRMGYASALAAYIVNHCDSTGYELAVALDAQPDISMDTKIHAIFSHI